MFQQNSREMRGEIAKVCFSVIASEANQSMSPRKERMDCFVASAPRNDGFGNLKIEAQSDLLKQSAIAQTKTRQVAPPRSKSRHPNTEDA
jgi:hypothetical protein